MPAFFLILACVLWALSFPLVKALHLEQTARLPDASSLFLASWMQVARFGLGAILLLPFALGKNRPTGDEITMWNEFMRKFGWRDKASEVLERRKREGGMEARSDIETMFQFIDADEGRKTVTSDM